MVLELSDHFVSLFCFDVVFDFGGEVEIIFGAVGSEKHSCDAKKSELEGEQMTLLLDDRTWKAEKQSWPRHDFSASMR